MEVSSCRQVVAAALGVLGHSRTLVKQLSVEHYGAICPLVGASIGGHMRHTLDHYSKLMGKMLHQGGSLSTSPIQYDLRERGTSVESEKEAALEKIDELCSQITKINAEDLQVKTKVAFMLSGDGEQHAFDSNLGRELGFVTHHAIHHNSMCKVIAANLGYSDFASGLGVAPSTAHHRLSTDGGKRGREAPSSTATT
ncbi:unnamed protein product [Heterosigma akashiwo]